MICLCSTFVDGKQSFCPVHKDKPLRTPTEWEIHMYAVRIYEKPRTQKYYYTIAKDAIQIFVSQEFDDKVSCISNVTLKPK